MYRTISACSPWYYNGFDEMDILDTTNSVAAWWYRMLGLCALIDNAWWLLFAFTPRKYVENKLLLIGIILCLLLKTILSSTRIYLLRVTESFNDWGGGRGVGISPPPPPQY